MKRRGTGVGVDSARSAFGIHQRFQPEAIQSRVGVIHHSITIFPHTPCKMGTLFQRLAGRARRLPH